MAKVGKKIGAAVRKLEDDRLGRLLATRRWCYVIPSDGFVKGFGWRVSIAIEKESGHYPTGDLRACDGDYEGGATLPWFWGETFEEARACCDEQNAKLGYTPLEAATIVASTMGATP